MSVASQGPAGKARDGGLYHAVVAPILPSSSFQVPTSCGEARNVVPVLHLPCLLSWSFLGCAAPVDTGGSPSCTSSNVLDAPISQRT